MNFWDQDHPLSADYNRLYEDLVPSSGECKTLQGELLRAASKINYDWFNNGWGCNNWSGAVVFLEQNYGFVASGRNEEDLTKYRHALSVAREHSHGERVSMSNKFIDGAVTTIAAFVTQAILNNPTPIPNEVDMWDLSEPDAPYEEDDFEDSEW